MAHVLLLRRQRRLEPSDEAGDLADAIRLDVPAGERLLDVLDELAMPALPLACRAMNCGICRIQVVRGADAIRPVSERELRLLQQLGAAADERLGCQVVVDIDNPESEIVLAIVRH